MYFSFSIYDVDKRGVLSKSTVFVLLKKCLENWDGGEMAVKFSDQHIKQLVEQTFNEADCRNGIINFADYIGMACAHSVGLPP